MQNGAYPPYGYTHDLGPSEGGARRASLDDLGGDQHQTDDAAPEIGVDYSATENDEQNRHVAAHERILWIAKLWVQFLSGVPTIIGVKAMGSNVGISTFTVTHPSTGQVQITWTTTDLAPQEQDPDTCSTSALRLPFGKVLSSPPTGKSGVLVEIYNPNTGLHADGDFTVGIQ